MGTGGVCAGPRGERNNLPPLREATAVAASVISRPENSNFPGDDDDDDDDDGEAA